jgi:phosphoribosylformylglycinamidine synthase
LIPDHKQPWEIDLGKPAHYASSLDIMLEAPIGSARFNNEFGRPCLTGCFRTLLVNFDAGSDGLETRGYHKPIMIAGGVGTVRPQHALKDGKDVKEEAHVIVLGGPAMLIGLGGGAASSSASNEGSAELDFASVQRGNPEMERRAQMVINACTALGEQNPIAFIHDVGAGGLSNALPELVHDAGFGGNFEIRQIDNADNSMSPLEIWCCEAQERYVIIVNKENLNRFVSIASKSFLVLCLLLLHLPLLHRRNVGSIL